MQPIDKDAMIALKRFRGRLTWQQYKTLKGQILSGNPGGAMKGLKKLIRREGENI